MPPPWYEIPPLDFFAENVVPGKIRDMRTYDYQLRPQAVVPQDELMARAENLRRGTQTLTGVAAPGYRVNPPGAPAYGSGQNYMPAPGAPGGPPIGSQPYYQLPSGPPGPGLPSEPIVTPPPTAAPVVPPAGGSIYQPPPSMPPSMPAGPSDIGSQPYHPLPSGQ